MRTKIYPLIIAFTALPLSIFSKGAPPGISVTASDFDLDYTSYGCSLNGQYLSWGAMPDTFVVTINPTDEVVFTGADLDPTSSSPVYFTVFNLNGQPLISANTFGSLT